MIAKKAAEARWQSDDPATAVEKILQIEGVKDVDTRVQRVVRSHAD